VGPDDAVAARVVGRLAVGDGKSNLSVTDAGHDSGFGYNAKSLTRGRREKYVSPSRGH
jgi:hypothetical protein